MPKIISNVEWEASELPTGIIIDEGTGKLSGTPKASLGTYTIPVKVTTNYGSDQQDVVLKVIGRLTIKNESLGTWNVNAPISVLLEAEYSGGEMGTLAWEIVEDESDMFSINKKTWNIYGEIEEAGTYYVTVKVKMTGGISAQKKLPVYIRNIVPSLDIIKYSNPSFLGQLFYINRLYYGKENLIQPKGKDICYDKTPGLDSLDYTLSYIAASGKELPLYSIDKVLNAHAYVGPLDLGFVKTHVMLWLSYDADRGMIVINNDSVLYDDVTQGVDVAPTDSVLPAIRLKIMTKYGDCHTTIAVEVP